MSYSNQPIHVVVGADDNYAMPLAVLIYSVLKNINSETIIHFYILDGGINIKNRRKLTTIFKNHSKSERNLLKWINPDLQSIELLPYRGWQTTATYLRLLIPGTLPSHLKKVIYLDSDLIVETDITELWNYKLKNLVARVVRDVNIQTLSHPTGVVNYDEYNGRANSPYFNAGVMLINLEMWRKEKISNKAMDYLLKHEESIKLNDQEALNAVLIGKWKELDLRWNQQGPIFWPKILPKTSFTEKIINMHHDLVNNPFIIHYLSSTKPWDYKCMHPFTDRFLFYLKESGWFTKTEWMIWWSQFYYRRLKWLFGDLRKTLNMVRFKRKEPSDLQSQINLG